MRFTLKKIHPKGFKIKSYYFENSFTNYTFYLFWYTEVSIKS